MRWFWGILFAALISTSAQAQTTSRPCYAANSVGAQPCTYVSPSSGMPVNIVGGGGSGGTSATDEATFTYGTSAYTPIGGVFNSSITNLTSGQGGAAALTAARSVHTLDDNSAAILTGVTSAIPAGTNTIGNVGTITPAGATAITASATGTTAATTATLAGTSGKTTYMCWLSIRANATAAATGNATVTGTITGTLNFTQWTAPLASGVGVVEEIFNPCVPASGTNTGIAIISAAPGSGGTVSVSGGGYQM